MVYRGIKRFTVAAELCDLRAFMRDTAVQNDLHSYRLDNGYGVTVLDPLKALHVTYADPSRGNSVDLHYNAIAPPVMFGDGNHFEQAMKVTGELLLRGEKYTVDCFNVRDRSWGKPRPEHVLPLPPMSWMTGVFDNNFAFNCNVFDQIDDSPALNGRFQMPEGRHLNGGWVYRAGVLGRVVRATKRVVREKDSFVPLTVHLDMIDEHDRAFSIRGTLLAACPWQVWPNLIFQIALMRWECDGLVAHGDCQDGLWNDYLWYFSQA
jgi:hypothetical protein